MAFAVVASSALALTTATSQSPSVTIDASADAVYFFFSGWASSSVNSVSSVTLGGNAPDETFQYTKPDSSSNAVYVAAWYAGGALPASGARTLAITLAHTMSDGPNGIIVQASGVDSVGWRGTGVDSYTGGESAGTAQSTTVTTVAGDEVLKCDYKYNATSSLPALSSGWTDVQTEFRNGGNCRISRIAASGTSVVCNSENENYSHVLGVVVRVAAGGGGTAVPVFRRHYQMMQTR